MFVNIGIITAASNEGELAAVMGHEMSHVYMQHSAKQQGKAQKTEEIAGLAGAILGATEKGVAGSLAQEGLKFGTEGLILKYSRTDEAQADHVGAIILYKAGYNPQAMADFFKKLASEGSAGPQFLNNHPNPGNREQAIEKEIASWPPQKYSVGDGSFTAARQHATSVKVYSAQEIARGAKTGQWAKLNKQNGATPWTDVFHYCLGSNCGNQGAFHSLTSRQVLKNLDLTQNLPAGLAVRFVSRCCHIRMIRVIPFKCPSAGRGPNLCLALL